jgi:WD40 repeat protein
MSQFGDTSAVTRGCFSPDDSLFATGGGSGEASVWSVPGCELRTSLKEGHLTKIHDLRFHPEAGDGLSAESYGNIVTASSDCTLRLWTLDLERTAQDSVVLAGHEDRVNRLRFLHDGRFLLSTSHDNTWRFWDIE